MSTKIQWILIFFSYFWSKYYQNQHCYFPFLCWLCILHVGQKNGSHSNCKGPNSQDINSHFVIQTNEPSLLFFATLCKNIQLGWKSSASNIWESTAADKYEMITIVKMCQKRIVILTTLPPVVTSWVWKGRNFGCLSFPPFLYTYPFSTRKVESCTKIQQSGTQKSFVIFWSLTLLYWAWKLLKWV